jgi:NADPH:quinone reductase-like Zn-dependent oxidoreductase
MAVDEKGHQTRYTGSGTNDNDVVIQTESIEARRYFELMSTTGAMDVLVSLDGTNYATAPLSLEDRGATTLDPVLVTAAGRVYRFIGAFVKVRVLQNGATAVANATLNCR